MTASHQDTEHILMHKYYITKYLMATFIPVGYHWRTVAPQGSASSCMDVPVQTHNPQK